MDEAVKAANEETRALTDEQVRQRIVQLAFAGSEERWQAFVEALRAVVPRDASVVLRGSVVTGVRWADGAVFDAEGVGTSDLDLTLVGGDMLKLFDSHYIPGMHSVPLSDHNPEAAPALQPLRRALCALTNRPVNIQATSSIVQYARDVLMDQPYFTVLEKEETPEDHPDGRISWREGTVLDEGTPHR
jgi:hypothetical protein